MIEYILSATMLTFAVMVLLLIKELNSKTHNNTN